MEVPTKVSRFQSFKARTIGSHNGGKDASPKKICASQVLPQYHHRVSILALCIGGVMDRIWVVFLRCPLHRSRRARDWDSKRSDRGSCRRIEYDLIGVSSVSKPGQGVVIVNIDLLFAVTHIAFV